MLSLSAETPSDNDEVETLFDLCFAPGREALSSYRLRDDVDPVAKLCRVARDSYNALAGAIRYWPVRIGQGGDAALLLGPIAVHPTHQGEGLAGQLIRDSLDTATGLGWERVILVGDIPYYARHGFAKAPMLKYPPPTNPDRLLARALVPSGLVNVYGLIRKWDPHPSP